MLLANGSRAGGELARPSVRRARSEGPAGSLRPRRRALTTVVSAAAKATDVIGLSNLCVDVIIPVDQLPPSDAPSRAALLQRLTAAPPGEEAWECGGISNFAIAAARLGLRTGTVGHLGSDVYGRYMERVLQTESITDIHRIAPPEIIGSDLDRTLACFVLVDPSGGHAFCSRYDFGPWPLLEGVDRLPPAVTAALAATRAVCMNGFVFDELPLALVEAAVAAASAAGAAVFFDPGPRCHTMKSGGRLEALSALMDLSDVVLMTLDEALEVTGHADPLAAAEAVLARPGARTRWAVVKEGAAGALLAEKGPGGRVTAYQSRAMKIKVADSVGCGDSAAAAVVAGFIAGHDPQGTLTLANAVGGATATRRGAGTNVADVATVERLLREAVANGTHTAAQVDSALALLRQTQLGGCGNGNGGAQRRGGERQPAAQAA